MCSESWLNAYRKTLLHLRTKITPVYYDLSMGRIYNKPISFKAPSTASSYGNSKSILFVLDSVSYILENKMKMLEVYHF